MLIVVEQPLEAQASDELDPAFAQFRDQTRFWIQRVAVPMLMVIGLFGNSITMIIMTRRGMRSTTNMYLAALAFVDMLYLVLTFLLGLSHYPNMAGSKYYAYWRLRPFLMMLTDACSNTSVWLTVTFTIERYIAVKYPMKANVWCTEARAKMLIVFVFMFGILFATPVPFEWKVIEKRVTTALKSSQVSEQMAASGATSSIQTGSEAFNDGSVDNLQLEAAGLINSTAIQAKDRNSNAELVDTIRMSDSDESFILALDYSDFGKNDTYKTVYYWSTAVIFYFIPLFSLMLFNGFLIKSVHQSRRERTKMTRRLTGCAATLQPYGQNSNAKPATPPPLSPRFTANQSNKLRATSTSQISSAPADSTEKVTKFSLNWPAGKIKLFLPSVMGNLYQTQTKTESPTVSSAQDEESMLQESGQKCPLIEWHCDSNSNSNNNNNNNKPTKSNLGEPDDLHFNKQQSLIQALPFVDDIALNSKLCLNPLPTPTETAPAITTMDFCESGTELNVQARCDNERSIVVNEARIESANSNSNNNNNISSLMEREQFQQQQQPEVQKAEGWIGVGAAPAIKTGETMTLQAVFQKKLSNCANVYHQANLSGQQQQQQVIVSASTQERRITIMLIAVVILFLVCQIPSAAMLLYTSVHELMPNTNEHALVLAFGNIFNFLMAVNAAGNFILYSFLSKKYRRTFMILFCSCLGSTRQKNQHQHQQLHQQQQQHNQTSRTTNSNNLRFEPSPGPSQRNSTSIFQNNRSSLKARRDTLV